MGRGRSKIGAGAPAQSAIKPAVATTPSGITHADLMQMPVGQRYSTLTQIANDPSIKVPSYLDGSKATKVMYALGMSGKPTVVPDAQLDSMQGYEVFRAINDAGTAITAGEIADQIRTGDYTQLSGKGGSLHGRALYFANNYLDASLYGNGAGTRMIRAKINPSANIVTEDRLSAEMRAAGLNVGATTGGYPLSTNPDQAALFAISRGYDGWYDPDAGYDMIINRGALTMSASTKAPYTPTGKVRHGMKQVTRASSWAKAKDA